MKQHWWIYSGFMEAQRDQFLPVEGRCGACRLVRTRRNPYAEWRFWREDWKGTLVYQPEGDCPKAAALDAQPDAVRSGT